MTKPKKKWEHLKDLACHCRILAILSIVFFGITSFILIIVCIASLGSGDSKYDTSKLFSTDQKTNEEKDEKDYAVMLLILTILAVLATVVSISLLFATLSDNMWLTIPYWLFLLVLLTLCLYQLLHFGLCVGRCKEMPDSLHKESPFAQNIMRGGGVYIFSSMAMAMAILYMFLPSFGYFLECHAKRQEELKERKKSIKPPPPPPHPPPHLAPHPILPPAPGPTPPVPAIPPPAVV